jgi:pimeloyl-ACP methyl ester carboxylesterase
MDLILLHGALGSRQDFEALTASLDNRFQVHTFNFYGHGGEIPSEPFTMELFTRNLLAYLDAHDMAQAALFGYSMGGYVALNLAHQFPERVSKIMTLGTKLSWSPEIAAQEVRQLDPEKIEEKVPKFAAALGRQHGEANWKSVVRQTATMMSGLGDQPTLSEKQFREIQTPVYLMRASEDTLATDVETNAVAAWIPGANTSSIPNAKHPLHTVDMEFLAQQLSAWF